MEGRPNRRKKLLFQIPPAKCGRRDLKEHCIEHAARSVSINSAALFSHVQIERDREGAKIEMDRLIIINLSTKTLSTNPFHLSVTIQIKQ